MPVEVHVVTPERELWAGNASTLLIARGVDGEVGIQAGHIPLLVQPRDRPAAGPARGRGRARRGRGRRVHARDVLERGRDPGGRDGLLRRVRRARSICPRLAPAPSGCAGQLTQNDDHAGRRGRPRGREGRAAEGPHPHRPRGLTYRATGRSRPYTVPPMDRLLVTGGARLEGSVRISGAKNSALKLMAAALLAPGRTVLHNVPRIQDCITMGQVLEHLGAEVAWDGGEVTIDATGLTSVEAPYELVRRMRASIVVLGPLLARAGQARVAMPGGDNIGSRPIDLHVSGLRKMGADISSEHGFLEARAPQGLRGAPVTLDYPSVGATENLMMAAVAARGHHRARQRRARAGDRRHRGSPGGDGRPDRGRRHQHDRDRGRGRVHARAPRRDPGSDRGGDVRGRGRRHAGRRDAHRRASRTPRPLPRQALRRRRADRSHDETGSACARRPARRPSTS